LLKKGEIEQSLPLEGVFASARLRRGRVIRSATKKSRGVSLGSFLLFYSTANVAAITALMVCIRFSASSKTMERSLSKTWSVTSIQSMPNLS